jgi:hypothetical protein
MVCLHFDVLERSNRQDFAHPAYRIDKARRSVSAAVASVPSGTATLVVTTQLGKTGQVPLRLWPLALAIGSIVPPGHCVQTARRNWSTAF